MIRQTNLIFRLGDLELYSLTIVDNQTQDPLKIVLKDEYWWVDRENPKGCGPFETIYAAVKHYENRHVKYDNVITVDFVLRKRKKQ